MFLEKRPAGGRIAPETRTFTKHKKQIKIDTRCFSEKNDPPEEHQRPGLLQKQTSFFRKTTRQRQDSIGDQNFYKNRCNCSEKRPAGGKIAPETQTFTKKQKTKHKNDPPEAG